MTDTISLWRNDDLETINVAKTEVRERISTDDGSVTASYDLIQTEGEQFAIRFRVDVEWDRSGAGYPWELHNTRQDCLNSFVKVALDCLERHWYRYANDAQRASIKEFQTLLAKLKR